MNTSEGEWRGSVSAKLRHIESQLEISREEFQVFVRDDKALHQAQAKDIHNALLRIESLVGDLNVVTTGLKAHEALDIRSFNRIWWFVGGAPVLIGIVLTAYSIWG